MSQANVIPFCQPPSTKNCNPSMEHCAYCRLKSFCLPFGLDEKESHLLDELKKETQVLHKGDLLIKSGMHFDKLFVVRSGSLKTYHQAHTGHEQILYFNLPGEMLGFDALKDGSHQFMVKALETSSVCSITFKELFLLAAEIPHLQLRLLTLASKPANQDNPIPLNSSAMQRIALFLLDLSERFKKRALSPVNFELSMSRHEIANHLGLTIETTSRMFSKLQKQNIIHFDKRSISIVDLRQLQQLACATTKDCS